MGIVHIITVLSVALMAAIVPNTVACPKNGLMRKSPTNWWGFISYEQLVLVGGTLFLLSDVVTKIADHLVANLHRDFIDRNVWLAQSADDSRWAEFRTTHHRGPARFFALGVH